MNAFSVKFLNQMLDSGLDRKFGYVIGRGAPGPSSSATQGRRLRAPVASHCGGPSPTRN